MCGIQWDVLCLLTFFFVGKPLATMYSAMFFGIVFFVLFFSVCQSYSSKTYFRLLIGYGNV